MFEFDFCCYKKCHDQKQVGERIYSILQVTFHHQGKPRQEGSLKKKKSQRQKYCLQACSIAHIQLPVLYNRGLPA